ncbi:MAG: carboxypeptidase regulatory-like domain-containing protein [Nocardioidaceae bacterium]
MSTRLRAFAVTILTACMVLVGLPAGAVEYVDDFVALPFTSYGDMLVDPAHGQVFVTGGSGTHEVAVVKLDGSGTTMIPGTPGAGNMSMSPDGRHVYVTLLDGDGVSEIDASTLTARRIDTGAGSCPSDVAVVAGYVWFLGSRGPDGFCYREAIRRLDPATGEVSPDIKLEYLDDAELSVLPGTTRLLYAERGSTTAVAGVFDVADGTLDNQVVRASIGSSYDTGLTTDGGHLMVSGAGRVSFYRTSDLSADGVSTLPTTPAAFAADTEILAAAVQSPSRVDVLRRGSNTSLNSIALGPTGAGQVRDMVLVGGQLFAVSGSPLRLYRLDRPAVPAPDLTLEVPTQADVGRPVTVTGVLSDRGTSIAGAQVTVRRQGADEPFGTATTDANGRYSLELVPPEVGPLDLSARYEGDPPTKPAVGKATLNVVRRAATLTIGSPSAVWPDEPFTLTGTLFDGADPVEGASLGVSRRCSNWSGTESVGTATTDPAGTFAIRVEPGTSGPWGEFCTSYDYWVTYDGDALRKAASASAKVAVTWRYPSFVLTMPDQVHVGDSVKVAGTVQTADGPLANAELTASVTTPTGGRELGTLTTDADGRFETTDVPGEAGSHCYRILYAGDSRTRAGYRDRCVGVTKLASALTLGGPLSGELDEALLLNGRVTSDGAPLAGVELVVSRSDAFGGSVTLSSVLTGADGGFLVRDAPPNGGFVTYAVSYPGSETRSAAAASWTVDVARPARTLELRADQRVYNYGQTAQLEVELTTDSARTVRVYAHEAGRVRTLIFSGDVPATGLTLQHRMTRRTQFIASVPEDGRALAASWELDVFTRAGLTTTASRHYGTSGKYKLYRPAADPRFATAVKPWREPDTACVRFQLQRHRSGLWRTVSTSACEPVGDGSTATWRLLGTQAAGTRYRVRPRFAGDAINVVKDGAWVYFKFV